MMHCITATTGADANNGSVRQRYRMSNVSSTELSVNISSLLRTTETYYGYTNETRSPYTLFLNHRELLFFEKNLAGFTCS